MTLCGTYDVPMVYGGNAVSLRPSLRAATQLEQYQGGFPALILKLQELDTATIKAVIHAAATDRQEATAFLSGLANKPLHMIDNTFLEPLYRLITGLMSPSRKPAETQSTGTPVEWSDLYADLFKIATGWLGWTPTDAWAATLIEITEAFDGHVAKLKALHGDGETDTADNAATDAAQRQANIDAGLDPDFDRSGLLALRNKLKANK